MAVTRHTRNGKTRRHTNGTFGAHMNGKPIGLKVRHIKQFKGDK